MPSSPTLFLIHGYASRVTYFTKKSKPPLEDIFAIYKSEIIDNTAHVYDWGIPFHIGYNIFKSLELYNLEQRKAFQPETVRTLKTDIHKKQPEIVVCHSMGCQLFLNYMQSHDLPDTTKHIIFVQPDFDASQVVQNKSIFKKLSVGQVTISVIHCWWDPSLIISNIINKNKRAGLYGWNEPFVQNFELSLNKPINIHQNVLADPRLKTLIRSIVST
jgi:Serine hydrolase